MVERTWRRSGRCATNAQCVELAVNGGRTAVRDSKNRDAGTLVFPTRAFRAFLDYARR